MIPFLLQASRSVARSGYLFVAPDWDFSVPLNRTKVSFRTNWDVVVVPTPWEINLIRRVFFAVFQSALPDNKGCVFFAMAGL